MESLRDAPWIEETERTGYCTTGWWNTPYEEDDEDDDDI